MSVIDKKSRCALSMVVVALLCNAMILPLQNSYAQPSPSPVDATSDSTTDAAVDQAAAPGTTEINLKNAEIAAIIRIFSKKTGRNYILDENVKGKVTIYLPGKVSSNEAVRILDSILALKGFTSVPISQNLWKIIPAKDAKQSTIPLVTGESSETTIPSAAVVTRIVPLKYVTVEDMKQLITPLVSPEGLVNGYTGTNSLLIIDSEDNIHRVVSIIEDLDVPSSDRDMTIIPVQNAAAVDIATKLNEILGSSATESTSSQGQSSDILRRRNDQTSRTNTPGGSQAAAQAVNLMGNTVTARAREPKITADERTNSVIVVADEETTARIRALISQLDSKVDLSGNKFYVYRCQHASAQELADVLGGLGSGGSSTGTSTSRTGFGTSSNQDSFGSNDGFGGTSRNRSSTSNRSGGSNRTQDRLSRQSRSPGQSRSSNNNRGSTGAVNLGEDISITADPATNSLIIYASKNDYERVLNLLKELDIKRRQVLVEAILLEVGIDESKTLGLSFLGSTGGADGGMLMQNGNIISTLSNPASIQNFAVAAASAGTLTLPNGTTVPTQSALLTAVQGNTNVNVLSAPTILTTDNEEAEIVVGQNVPFLASTSSSETNLNNTFNQIDRQDVGITLRLTPQISSGEFVTLKIFTEVSNVVGDTASSSLGPTTTIRTSDTTVITKDSQMVVTGGLISDDISDSESGVPYLQDIPVLGHLFKTSGDRHRKTNLLIFITPRIIKDQFDHREITIAKRNTTEEQMAELGSFPDRTEVLHDDRIDNVSEAQPWDGPKPGTILPPVKERIENRKIVLDELSSGNDDTIELKISPRLPDVPHGAGIKDSEATLPLPAERKESREKLPPQPELAPERNGDTRPQGFAPAAALAISPRAADTAVDATASQAQRFVVLELAKGQKLPKNVPFAQATGGNLVAVDIGSDNLLSVHQFFSTGRQYQYSIDGRDLLFTAIGVYSDQPNAKKLHKQLPARWYSLSPYEIMNLGAGPWRAVN